ncbi:DUF7560 family zinc ribbon protein [Salinigranum rubrum]
MESHIGDTVGGRKDVPTRRSSTPSTGTSRSVETAVDSGLRAALLDDGCVLCEATVETGDFTSPDDFEE